MLPADLAFTWQLQDVKAPNAEADREALVAELRGIDV
jgi:hypothetical protein